ncbi:MAG: 16S rRNA methyltransferase [Candidatus Aramenus sulfurataquae]|uniref:16S rRNA methyltransferase n=1 Tax=Candidatus Aramenus sulfurataquae TaxID=1326980 RepID=A0ACC6TNC2_9CREN
MIVLSVGNNLRVNVILLDSSLELVPREISNHPSVVKNAKKRGKKPTEVLLDISVHYFAMKNLKDREKRGRPDIVHSAMILFLTEPFVRGDLYIHTIDSKIIKVNREVRPPKNYNRFVSLMEQLLINGKVPPESQNPLMEVTDLTLSDLSKEYKLVLLSEDGTYVPPTKLCEEIDDKTLLGIGAFPHGKFSREVLELFKESYSISSVPLETNQVLCRILSSCNEKLGWP